MSDGPALATTAATAGAYLGDKLRALDERLKLVALRVLASADDAQAVHDLRVALRRTRVVLEVGRRVLGRFHTDEVRRALRDVQRATGALRDEEVLLELVRSLGVTHPDVQRWLESRGRREHRLRGALVAAVRAGELDDGLRLLEALLAFRVNPSRDRRLAKLARRAVDDARREVDRRRGARPDDPEALHRLRIAYKRLRYTVDTFADVLPSDFVALAQPAARFQGRIGDLHDVDVALGCVRRARSLSDEARTELLAALTHTREERVALYVKELGVAAIAPAVQAVGTESLRKISTR
ncbi:MAG TPA: CHAD domain-containing protein [Polyangiaceae bacterium]